LVVSNELLSLFVLIYDNNRRTGTRSRILHIYRGHTFHVALLAELWRVAESLLLNSRCWRDHWRPRSLRLLELGRAGHSSIWTIFSICSMVCDIVEIMSSVIATEPAFLLNISLVFLGCYLDRLQGHDCLWSCLIRVHAEGVLMSRRIWVLNCTRRHQHARWIRILRGEVAEVVNFLLRRIGICRWDADQTCPHRVRDHTLSLQLGSLAEFQLAHRVGKNRVLLVLARLSPSEIGLLCPCVLTADLVWCLSPVYILAS